MRSAEVLTLLTNQLTERFPEPALPHYARYETPLRVAAGTLQRATADEVRATTVVGQAGPDDRTAFESLVQRVADEGCIQARIRWRAESFSVRFSRRFEEELAPLHRASATRCPLGFGVGS